MPNFYRSILSVLLPVFLLPVAGCMGDFGSGNQYKFSTSVVVIAPATSVTENQPVTLEAVLPGGALATGTVTFYNGSKSIGSATVSGPVGFSMDEIALLSTTFSSNGVQSITATYSGDEFNSSSTSQPTLIGVYSNQLAASSVILQSSTTTPQYQTSVTLTAEVTPSTATGTVTFYNGGANIGSAAVTDGSASLTTSFAAGGLAKLHAVYSGDYTYLSSTSNSLSMNISGPLVTMTTLQASASSVAIGESITLTANLSPATATGTVTFYSGSTAIGTANVNGGIATLSTSFAGPGKIALLAMLNANASWETSTSNQIPLFVTGNTPDTVVLQIDSASLFIGYSATLTANVSPMEATGTIVFYDGRSVIGNCTLAGGSCTLVNAFMAAGSRSLTAVYSGDMTYLSKTSGAVALDVSNPGPTPTTTTLTLSESTGWTGDTVTLSANVNPSTATGQVDFYSNGSLMESVVLSSGTAAWSQVFALDGTFNITAVYDGDVTYASSSSSEQVLYISDPSDISDPIDPVDPIDPML
ncbi:MAG: Ig-like domain-containing protein [Terracidiphilus sp.]